MFAFNDAWLINESLALHVSTNTFSNPAFDQDQIDFANCDALGGSGVPVPNDGQPSSSSQDRKRDGAKRSSGQTSFKSSFADNLAFAIKSKLFVIDLNFKRRIRSIKAFAIRHFPGIFESATQSRESRGRSSKNYTDSRRFMGGNKIHDGSFMNDEHFWKNIVEPSSRKSLGKQKEKILSRLERALEQKRNQPEHYHDYQQHQLQKQQTGAGDGLRHIRPGIVGPPIYRDSPSSSSRSSLASSFVPQSPRFGHEPLLVGSQNLAKRYCSAKAHQGASSKWKHIRDIVFDDCEDGEVQPSSSKKLCIVCYTNTPNIVTLPCKHHDVCSDCFVEMIYIAVKKSQYPLKCALCRQKVEKISCSRKLLLSVIEKQRIYP